MPHHLFDVSFATKIDSVYLRDGPANEDRCQQRPLKKRIELVAVELELQNMMARGRTPLAGLE